MNYFLNTMYLLGIDPVKIGLVMIVVGVWGDKGGWCPHSIAGPLALIGTGLTLLGLVLQKKILGDKGYDASVRSYVSEEKLKTLALSKLGIDEDEVKEIPPIIFGGYDFDGADMCKEGNDKKWRSNIYKVVMLFFSQNEMHCYTIRYKTTEEFKAEETEVYFYRDIVSVSTKSVEKLKIKEKEVPVNLEAFTLVTKGGTSISVNLLNSSDAQKSVNAMRALLREKKQG